MRYSITCGAWWCLDSVRAFASKHKVDVRVSGQVLLLADLCTPVDESNAANKQVLGFERHLVSCSGGHDHEESFRPLGSEGHVYGKRVMWGRASGRKKCWQMSFSRLQAAKPCPASA